MHCWDTNETTTWSITKYSGTRQQQPRPGTTGNSRKIMIRSLEASLRRLNTDHVDVFMPHFPDGTTPIEEILAGLDHLVGSGKILHGGLSNFPAWRVAGAAVRAGERGLAPLVGIETEYSLAERSAERELLPMAEAHGLGVLLYSPLAGGLLTGKYRHGDQGRLSARGDAIEGTAQRSAVLDAVLAMAEELGTTASAVSLAWLRHRAAVASTALITDRGAPLARAPGRIPPVAGTRTRRPPVPAPRRAQRSQPRNPAPGRRSSAQPRLRRQQSTTSISISTRPLITRSPVPRPRGRP